MKAIYRIALLAIALGVAGSTTTAKPKVPRAPAPTVTFQTITTGGHSAILTWAASTTAGATYFVYSGIGSGKESTTPVNATAITGTTYTDTTSPGLVSGNNMCWELKAYLSTNPAAQQYSALSNEVCATVPYNPPAPPVLNPPTVSQTLPFNPIELPAACLTTKASVLSILNASLPVSEAGSFQITWTATPGATPTDGVMGLSQGVAAGYANMAAIVRFNPSSGIIDSYNGTAYGELVQIKYAAGVAYRVTFVVDVPTQTYDAYVNGTQLAKAYKFRTPVTALTNVALVSETSTVTVCADTAV